MTRMIGRDETGTSYLSAPSPNLGSSASIAVDRTRPDPAHASRPVGFTAKLESCSNDDPLLWEGDYS